MPSRDGSYLSFGVDVIDLRLAGEVEPAVVIGLEVFELFQPLGYGLDLPIAAHQRDCPGGPRRRSCGHGPGSDRRDDQQRPSSVA